uniref:Uncharacterized protein n=1 Tax=Anguilla anguilla TaxID=7936 RepID=A0A0E9VPX8_ANGAN
MTSSPTSLLRNIKKKNPPTTQLTTEQKKKKKPNLVKLYKKV